MNFKAHLHKKLQVYCTFACISNAFLRSLHFLWSHYGLLWDFMGSACLCIYMQCVNFCAFAVQKTSAYCNFFHGNSVNFAQDPNADSLNITHIKKNSSTAICFLFLSASSSLLHSRTKTRRESESTVSQWSDLVAVHVGVNLTKDAHWQDERPHTWPHH